MTHALKTWPEFYKEVESGNKNFELRKFDRPFKIGDIILLQEYDATNGGYTTKELKRRITYILTGDFSSFGLIDGYCILGMEEIEY